jgi:hypothetical protein
MEWLRNKRKSDDKSTRKNVTGVLWMLESKVSFLFRTSLSLTFQQTKQSQHKPTEPSEVAECEEISLEKNNEWDLMISYSWAQQPLVMEVCIRYVLVLCVHCVHI